MHYPIKKMNNEQLKVELQQIIENQATRPTADPETTLQAALTAYQNARTDGLCHEGAWEIALQTLKNAS